MTRAVATIATLPLAAALCLPTTPAQAVPTTPPAPAGWTVLTLAPAAQAAPRLVLVSPTGSQRVVTRLQAGERVADVGRDGRRVVIERNTSTWDRRGSHYLVDLTTGRASAIAGHWATVRLTRPTGASLLVEEIGDSGPVDTSGRAHRILRTDLGGRLKAVMAQTAQSGSALQDPSGRFVVSSALVVNDNASGRMLRRLPQPRDTDLCLPRHFTSATTFTATCLHRWSPRGLEQLTYQFSLSGKAPVRLAAGAVGNTHDDVTDVWTTPQGTFARVGGGLTPGRIVTRSGNRWRTWASFGNGAVISGRRAYLLLGSGDASTSMVQRDLGTGRQVVLAGGSRNPRQVVTSAAIVG